MVGSEPQIYFYARRKAATSYLYTYPLMETHPYAGQMTDEMIEQIESAKPAYLVLVKNPLSWLSSQESDTRIFYWFHSYSTKHYRPVAYVDMIRPNTTVYVSGKECETYRPRSEFGMQVMRRIDG